MSNLWKIGIGAVVLIVVAVATAGFVNAQTDEDGEGPMRDFVGRLAEKLGISKDELATAIDETQLDIVDELEADGTLDEEQADRLRERIESGEGGLLGPMIGHKLRMHDGPFAGMHALDSYADAAGISVPELVEAWEGEGTLGEVLADLGVDTDAVTAQIVADLEARLTEMDVAQERIDEIVTNAPEKLSDLLASEDPPERPFGSGNLGHGFPGDEPTDVTEAVSPTF